MKKRARKTAGTKRQPEDVLRETLDRARLRKKAASLFLAAALGSLIVYTITGERGAISLYRKWQERRALQAELVALEQRNDGKRAENARLRDEPEAVEKIAREELDLLRPGEVMFVLPEGVEERRPTAPPPTPPPSVP